MTPARGEGWIDVSVLLRSGMVHWPDNPPVRIERMLDIERGDAANVSKISMGSHTGTHIDAPLHFVRGGAGLDEMPLDAAIGRARVIEVHDPESIKPDELRPHKIHGGERILFKTRNSTRGWQEGAFIEDFVYVSKEAARYLAAREVRTVGIDYLSVGGFLRARTIAMMRHGFGGHAYGPSEAVVRERRGDASEASYASRLKHPIAERSLLR